MASNKRGKQSIVFGKPPVISAWASVAGKKESEGPLAHTFDITGQDSYFSQRTWEQAEKQLQRMALSKLAEKACMKITDFDLVFSGDLLNQCIGSSFSLRNTGIPHLGLYGACSTMAESLLLASMTVSGGFRERVVAMTSSHFASSERQYRFSPGVWWSADTHFPMDGNRLRCGPCLPCGTRAESNRLHHRQYHRSGYQGCQQHGGSHGSRSLEYHTDTL